MKAVIVGGGEVGYHLADRLSKEGHSITLIEKDLAREDHLRETVNARVIRGNGASAAVLEEAGIRGADIFIAVTDVDEVNMVACLIAKKYNVPRKIARVKSLEYGQETSKINAETMGIDLLINPQKVVADEIVEMIYYSNAVEAAEFAEGKVLFLGYSVHEGSPLIGKALQDLGWTQGKARMVVAYITRGDKSIFPRGETTIEASDILFIVCDRNNLPEIHKLFGFEEVEQKKLFVIGAGLVGQEVVSRLNDGHHEIKVIDKNDTHCQALADRYDNVLVLCTTSTDTQTLKNEGIAKGDTVIAVTNDDQSNILGSLLAKKYGVKRAISLVNQPELSNLAVSLGIDACISPRLSTASAILKYIRAGNVLSIVEQSDAELLELELSSNTRIFNKPIHSIDVPKGAIIGAIVRGQEVIIPGGNDELKQGDHVIIFSLLKSVPKVEKFFS